MGYIRGSRKSCKRVAFEPKCRTGDGDVTLSKVGYGLAGICGYNHTQATSSRPVHRVDAVKGR
jgi:hypothetical protein